MKFLHDLFSHQYKVNSMVQAMKSAPKKEFCGALSPGNNESEDPDDWQLKCTDVPGHKGKHAAGVMCGTLTWVNEKVWYEKEEI